MKTKYLEILKEILLLLIAPSSMFCHWSESTSILLGSSVINSDAMNKWDCHITKLRAIGKATEQRQPLKRITGNVITCGRCMFISHMKTTPS